MNNARILDPANFWPRLLRYYRLSILRESGFGELIQRATTGNRYTLIRDTAEPLLSDVNGAVAVDERIRVLANQAVARGEALFYGFPVLLFHESPTAETPSIRRKLAPLIVFELALPEPGAPLPESLLPRSDEPFLFGAAMSRLGYRGEQQAALLDTVRFEDWLGDAESVGENLTQLLAQLGVRIIEPIVPSRLGRARDGEIDGVGAHNVGMVFRTTRAEYHGNLLDELALLEKRWSHAQLTAASFLLGPPGQQYEAARQQGLGARERRQPTGRAPLVELATPTPLNDSQRAALQDALTAPLTVVTGPPGTGKSQLVTSIVASAWLSGQTVLVASTNNQAVDVACARSHAIWRGLIIRTGARASREAAKELLLELVNSRETSPDASALRARFQSTRDRAAQALHMIDDSTAKEERLVAVQLGRELLAQSLTLTLSNLEALPSRLVRRLVRTADLSIAGRAFFREWRLRRLSRALWREVKAIAMGQLHEVLELLRLELERRALIDVLANRASFDEQWRTLIAADRAFEQSSAELARATAQQSFKDGSHAIRRFALARYRFGGAGGPSEVFPDALPFARAWASTSLSVAASIPPSPALFDLLVVDEASQCSIPALLPLLFRARRAVIIGDPMQLAHITTLTRNDDEALLGTAELRLDEVEQARLNYRRHSLFRALESVAPRVHILDEHYRSHPSIIEFSNRHFYHGGLTVLTDPQRLLDLDLPAISWRNVQGRAIRPDGGSAFNQAEIVASAEVVRQLARRDGFTGSVGVVTPFSQQARMILEALEQELAEPDRRRLLLSVGTAHRFQGDERDIIVFSPVVADGLPAQSIGWLVGTPNLLNVAITRARSVLIVVGHRSFCLGLDGPVGDLARYVAEVEALERVESAGARGELHSAAEARLFQSLCFHGLDVTPKVRVMGYEADFVIRGASTIVNLECDGRQHLDGAGRLRRQDRARDSLIQATGWRVLRVPAWRCLTEPDAVALEVSRVIASDRSIASDDAPLE